MRICVLLLVVIFNVSCNYGERYETPTDTLASSNISTPSPKADTLGVISKVKPPLPAGHNIITADVAASDLVAYAKTLIGTPYLYASTDPAKGFDCSGFITYVFNHFNIKVPRSSIDFTDVNDEVSLEQARPGDLVLFTGTDPASREVGHMGIIISNGVPASFIHSTSGKQYGVTITPLNEYYMKRFVKVIRVFPSNR
jgi:cell wall-associated NlpC family hydrolase